MLINLLEVAPGNDEIKRLNNVFNGLKEQGEKATGILARQMTAHLEEKEAQERKAYLERQRLEMEQRRQEATNLKELSDLGDEQAATQLARNDLRDKEATRGDAPPPKTVVRGNVGRSSMVKGKITIRVINISHVPARYLEVNESAVRAAFHSGVRNIVGLEVEQEQTLRVG